MNASRSFLFVLALQAGGCGGITEPMELEDDDARSGDRDTAEREQLGLESACAEPSPPSPEDAGADGGSGTSAPEPALRESGHLIGAALTTRRMDDALYRETAARHFNYVTPENEMKWDAIEPAPGRFEFGAADAIVQFAEANDMLVKGHTLVWHSQLPEWARELDQAQQVRSAMTRHIEGVTAHYREQFPGRVVAWDVVNEALDSSGGSVIYRDSVFHRLLGEDFIAEAFELAHAADPDALLFYNDYGIEDLGPKSQATFEMIRDLVEADVPIDGIGFQMHVSVVNFAPTREEFAQNLARYTELGLLVNISEMDVSLCRGSLSRENVFADQRIRYNELVGTCLDNPQCDSVTLWGVADRDSWLNFQQPCDNPSLSPEPLVFDDDYEPKPAWWGVHDALIGCHTWR